MPSYNINIEKKFQTREGKTGQRVNIHIITPIRLSPTPPPSIHARSLVCKAQKAVGDSENP